MVRIALDAGHGRNTAGKRIPRQLDKNQTREWVLNDRVARYVESYLRDYEGYKLLRVDDRAGKTDVPLATRARKANEFKADVYVSIHHNAFQGKPWNGGGIVVYRYPNSKKMTHAMAKRLYDELIKETGLKGNRASPIAEANFQVLRQTYAPAILIENGFMDSKVDAPIILTDAHAKKSAKAIVRWLAKEFKLKKKPKPTPKPTGKGYYRVVVGSYKDKANAERQQKKLKDKGFDSFLAFYDE